ncbi:MAG: PA2779 family protein [Deltaproteobacteria bacterium]|nr:PA2779 family protein [Deltaproteobacteria bacterium]
MAYARKAGWFVVLAVAMAGWMGVLGTLRGVAEAGVIGSRMPDGTASPEDLATVQSFLENKIVAQKLIDYGVSPEEAMAKVRAMSPQELHQLASLTDRTAEGADSALGILIGIAILVLIIVLILKLAEKEIIIR